MATLDRLAPPPAALGSSTWSPRRAIIVTLTLAAIIALLQVLQSSSFAHTGHQLQLLEAQKTQMKAEMHQLESEVAALASLDRTERAARERLGMVPARNIQYISVSVEAPADPLLPRPLLNNAKQVQTPSEPWWRSLYKALPLP
jgi:cell division protein FtsL